jgi:hypothetical protein
MAGKYRWVQKRIDSLDPETQYNEIMKLVADYQLNYIAMNLTVVVSLAGANLSPDGPEMLIDTGKVLDRSEARFDDSADYFFTWFFNGTDSDEFKKSVEKLNRWHMALAEKYPGPFSRNDDWVYTICSLGMISPRIREALGLKPQSKNLDIAWYNFLRDVSENMRGLQGPITDFPEDFEGMRRFVEEFESRDWPQSDEGAHVINWVVQHVLDRWFPKPLHWYGRDLFRLVTPEPIRRAHRMGDPGRITGPIVKYTFGTYMRLKESVLPDRRIPFSVWVNTPDAKLAAEQRRQKMTHIYQKRVAEGEITPGAISMCPVTHVPVAAARNVSPHS